ncbi:hypothetical protein BB559_004027 [Furculomyces boomerangus]|uniref:Large ribosomal subunit protein uL6 N-terminal domain-containing protein n=2 Tax=Harpellales TaxID=61421 RepID=A0A2T9YHC2_9FUNG|nr:hypothetical protein BB559_004027 [Furculomyces boomerangus]PVZ98040.1 hypothetical protein BB558_005953 [Smittium angustum]PVZ98186.1 hypothetical protein BB558_005841 [Smittium angustum]
MAIKSDKAQIIPGVSRYSRSQRYSKRGLYLIKKKAAETKKEAAPKSAPPARAAHAANKDLVESLTYSKSRFYPADTVSKPKANHKAVRPTKLRSSIKPGSVLILLAGRFRGKRVVFLKQLESGLLLVTGPYRVNGVPLRRVNQAYTIATSTQIDISGVKIDSSINDSYFAHEKEEKLKGTEEEFFGEGAKKREAPANKVAIQKEVDNQLIPIIAAQPLMKSYLKSSFSLTKGQAPHLMKF